MKTIRYWSLPLSVLLLATACSKMIGEPPAPGAAVSEAGWETKVLQLSAEYAPATYMVKFAQVPGEEQLASLMGEGVLSVEPLFLSRPGKEDLEHRFGLDRWYEVQLQEGAVLKEHIRQVASLEAVEMVEYACIPQKASDGVVYPVTEKGLTKATSGVFNDPMLSDQWNYYNMGSTSFSAAAAKGADVNVTDAWKQLSGGDPSIVVAVVDEGVCYTNPDLAANMWVNEGEIPGNGVDDDGNGYVDDVHGFNFVTNGAVTWDDFYYDENQRQTLGDTGHGSHCAGTIAAVNNNGKGVCGVAGGTGKGDGCRIMSCQVFSGTGSGSTAKAVKYAADNGASIISCSYGFTVAFQSDNAYIRRVGSSEIDAIHYFEATKGNNDVLDGNIAIFAAGNDNQNFAHYPGAFYDIISVSAFAPDFLPTYYTNYGPGCNISAPGGEVYHIKDATNYARSMILSTVPAVRYDGADYGYMQGTSMACPHVSGVVALALSYAHQLGKKFDRDEFKRMILSSVNDIDQRIGKTAEKTYAYGRGPLALAPYYHQMGTGAIDAWRLLMKIEGTPTLTAQIGREQWIDLSTTFGTASVSLTYLKVEVPEETVAALGLQKIRGSADDKYPAVPVGDCYAYVQFGRLYIHPTKLGSGKFKVTAVGGGDHLGGGDNPPGGYEMEQDLSVIAREADGGNGTGGWL